MKARDAGREAVPAYVCFSGQDWWYWSHAHSDFQVMTRIAETRPVLFVNSIGMRMPLPGRSSQPLRRIARKARSMSKWLRRPDPELPNLAVLTPVILPFYGVAALRALNARLVAAQVRWALRRLDMVTPICVVTLPTAADVIDHLDCAAIVYNRSDRHSAFGEADGGMVRSLEERLLRDADRVLYVSGALMADEAALTGERAAFIDHGVDVDHFARRDDRDEPEDIAGLPRPRIGYFGGFDDYLVDFDLIEQVAVAFPDATILLVGPATCSMRRFEALANVRWLGARAYADIPGYGAAFDVALMPWLDNEWLRFANPIKMKEYLALGSAVVSTDFPEVHRYADVIRIGRTSEEFVDLVRESLVDGGPATSEQRRAAVADATWDAVAARVRELCESEDQAAAPVLVESW